MQNQGLTGSLLYSEAATRSLPRKCVTSSVLFSTADGLAQHVFEEQPLSKHEWARTARMGAWGGCGK